LGSLGRLGEAMNGAGAPLGPLRKPGGEQRRSQGGGRRSIQERERQNDPLDGFRFVSATRPSSRAIW